LPPGFRPARKIDVVDECGKIIFQHTIARKCHESIESVKLYCPRQKPARDKGFLHTQEALVPRWPLLSTLERARFDEALTGS
jgi:hypothetical protein